MLLYDIDLVDGNSICQLFGRSVQKYQTTVQLLRYNNHICYVSNINAVLPSYRRPNYEIFFQRTINLKRFLTLSRERVENVYPKNAYQPEKTLFEKLDSFGIEYTIEQTLFKNSATSDFESICVQEESFKDTDATEWIGKHISISVSISLNLVKEPIFLCYSDPHHLDTSFIGALEILVLQSKVIIKNLFSDIKTTMRIKLGSILEKLTRRHIRKEQADLDDCDNETYSSIEVLHIQKKQLYGLQEHRERYCNVSPIFGFNSAEYGLNLMKSSLFPIFVEKRTIEPTVIKKTN